MRVLALLFAMFFCGAVAAELKIASFNVQNLFDGVNDGTEYADFEIGRGGWSEQKYERKLQAVADEISALNADILGLQEIENEAVLKALAQKAGYKFYAFSRAQTAPAGVAVMSRIPIKFQKTYRPTELKTRDILRADFALGGADFSFYVVHMLSARNPLSERKRNFAFLREVLQGHQRAIIAGDFNTNFGRNSLLNELIERDGFSDLWALHPCSQLKHFSSCESHESGAVLDHILLSDDFFSSEPGYKKDSFAVAKSSTASDHFPISFILTNEGALKSMPKKQEFLARNTASSAKTVTIEELYGRIISEPVLIKGVVVSFANRHGFAVSQDGSGVFVYGGSGLQLGDKLDLLVKKTKFYKQSFEIDDYEIVARSGNVGSIAPYVLPSASVRQLRAGDVISTIKGDVEDGIIDIKSAGEFRIFRKSAPIQNGKNLEFKNAYFTIYKGQKEFIVE